MADGFVKIPRKLLEHPTWDALTGEGKLVVLLCFIHSNYKESVVDIDREMVTLKPGDWLTSIETIRKKAGRGMSVKNIRTALDRLTTGKILASKLAKGNKRIISIDNSFFDDSENEVAKQTAKNWQRSGKGLARSKEREEGKEGKEESILNTFCSEPQAASKPPSIVFNFSTSLFENLMPEQLALWADAFPAVDVQGEIKRAGAWLAANPAKRKKNYKAFLTGWLNRGQQRGGNILSNRIKPTGGETDTWKNQKPRGITI